ncbi:MAG: hypothetical protein WBL72_16245 [Thermoguttaceae bacterium]
MKAIVSVVLMGLALVFVGCGRNHDADKEARDKKVEVKVDRAAEEAADKAKADAEKLKADAKKATKLIDKVKHDL